MNDAFVKSVIEELNEEAFEEYTTYISSILDFHTNGSKHIKKTDIYRKMDELCQLSKLSALTRNPKCYSEQLLYYYRAYAICDRSITSVGITPAHVFWDRGIKSLRNFMDCEQSFKNIELMEDAVKIFLCIMREIFKHTKTETYSCKMIRFSINEKDIETINILHQKKTKGKYVGIRPKLKGFWGKAIIVPYVEENITAKQTQHQKDYIYMVTAALYCRIMESEGFY